MRRSAAHDDVTAPLSAQRAFRALVIALAMALVVLVAPAASQSRPHHATPYPPTTTRTTDRSFTTQPRKTG
jgi:hypothetical protein